MPRFMLPLVTATMLVWCAPVFLQGCGSQETTSSTVPFQPGGVSRSAHRYLRRYMPGVPFEVTCNTTRRINSHSSFYPCTVVIASPRKVFSLNCESSDSEDTDDACFLTGSL